MNGIWLKGLSEEKNILAAFQYRLTPCEKTEIKIAAAQLYRIFVNGDFVGYGPARAAHGYSRVDSYDLSPWQEKEILITVEVHSANVNSYYLIDERPFFAAEIFEGEKLVAAAKDFDAFRVTSRVQKVRKFSFQRTFTEIYRLGEDPQLFYEGKAFPYPRSETEEVSINKLLPRYVNYPKYDRKEMTLLEEGRVTVDPEGLPYRDRVYTAIDPVSRKGFYPSEIEDDAADIVNKFRYRAFDEVTGGNMAPDTYRFYDLSRTITGFFTLHLNVLEDANVYIIFEEVEIKEKDHRRVDPFRGTCTNIVKYELKAGEYHLLNFEANSAKFVCLAVMGGSAEICDFAMLTYENPDAEGFSYDYGDEELNLIVDAAVNTFAQNAVDVLTDCPSRERAGWLCDTYFSSRTEAHLTGKNLVEKSFLENYALCGQRPTLPKGMIPMCYPCDQPNGRYIPNWSMWYILELLAYVKRTGDEEMRRISKPRVMGLLDFFKNYENEFGLLENLESWVFVEWSMCNDDKYVAGINFPSNMLWASALQAVAELYDMPHLSEKAEIMRDTIRKMSFNGTFFEENMIRDEKGVAVRTGHTTETCQYYAFYFGTADKKDYPELFELLRTTFGPKRDAEKTYPTVYPSNAIVGNYLRLEILIREGFYEQVLQECRDFFLGMARLTGTLWEHSKLSCSLNHGFASMAAVYIDQCKKALSE